MQAPDEKSPLATPARPQDAPKRPRIKQTPEPMPSDDEPEAPVPDRGVAPGITG
jgi:hypothetical protein